MYTVRIYGIRYILYYSHILLLPSTQFAIHTTRKRLIGVQRELKASGQDFRALEILNLGKYERSQFTALNEHLREVDKKKQSEMKEAEFIQLILSAYKAEQADGFKTIQGKKNGRLVAIGPVNIPITRLFGCG